MIHECVRCRRKGYDDDAFELLKDVPASSSYPEKWWVERSILARRLLEKGHITDAYHLASNNGLTSGARFVEAEWLSGWIALRFLDDAKLAVKHFQRIRQTVKYPISIARAEYWIGRSMEKTKASRQAALSFAAASKQGTTYYGQLAAARSGKTLTLAKTEIRPSPAEIKIFENDERVRAIRMLYQLRETGSIQYFASALMNQSDNPVRLVLVARLAEEIGRSDLAALAGRRSYRIAKPLPDIAYPVIGVPNGRTEKALLHALIRQESNFDHQAISSAGARGLMQLMPATARSVAKKIKIRYSLKRLTRDRSYNIRLGSAYLGGLLTRFDGSYVLAIAAYNAGRGAVNRWVRKFGDPRDKNVDVIDWIESIPYRETRNYVQRVMENLQMYRGRLGGQLIAKNLVSDLNR